MIIFLSNFLALLIKVDAGEVNNRNVFGALLVAINVLLVLAVLVTSWFATQQSVDDHREGETTFNMAQTMLTAEQYAASGARLKGSGRVSRSRTSSASVRPGLSSPEPPTDVRPGLPRSDQGVVWRGPTHALRRQLSGETVLTDEALPGLAQAETASSPVAGMWGGSSNHGSSWY